MDEIKLDLNQDEGKIVLSQSAANPQTPLPIAPEPKVNILPHKLLLLKKIAENLQTTARQLSDFITLELGGVEQTPIKMATLTPVLPETAGEQIIEGLFDGEKMLADSGQRYDVSPNYASKSKLVVGDQLKLLITDNGHFIYKQIKPVERQRLVGILEQSEDGWHYAMVEGRRWRLLNAAVSYFHGNPGDEVVMLIPTAGEARFAAVENIVKSRNT